MPIIEVRPDSGGQDAEAFARLLAQSIQKFLLRQGYQVEAQPFSELERSFALVVNAPLSALKWLEGVHAVQRIPKGSAARHTSLATVVARSEVREEEVLINPDDIRVDYYRGTGKGGQKRNKTSSAVRVLHKPTGIMVTRESGRSQSANLESAMLQLREQLQQTQRKREHSVVDAQRNVIASGVKTFTHNYQRGEVVEHKTGRRWSTKAWTSGRIA